LCKLNLRNPSIAFLILSFIRHWNLRSSKWFHHPLCILNAKAEPVASVELAPPPPSSWISVYYPLCILNARAELIAPVELTLLHLSLLGFHFWSMRISTNCANGSYVTLSLLL
jgi:hypothetical protein